MVEKTGLYSFLILFTLGITRGKWATMVDALADFKTDYDSNAPLRQDAAERRRRARVRRLGPARPVRALHACYRDNDTPRADERDVHRAAAAGDEAVATPTTLVHGDVEPVPIDEAEGRITAVMVVPYPPGIPLIMPGERFMTSSIIEYLKFARDTDDRFPGFEADIHGLMSMVELEGVGVEGDKYFVDCVR